MAAVQPKLFREIHISMPSPTRRFSQLVIYLGFAATGVGMALPGSVMPVLIARWSLSDRQAGLLLFLGWLGSALGALTVRPSRTRSLAAGACLSAIGASGMICSLRWTSFPSIAIFGLGLGLTMTATSLLQSARYQHKRSAELNRLNLIWALGACICPRLAEQSLRVTSITTLFTCLALLFSAIGLWIFLVEPDPPAAAIPTGLPRMQWSLGAWPLPLVFIILLPTGIESSMGGWVAAYVQRTHHMVTTTVTAGTCFWAGLMLSRTLASTLLYLRRYEQPVLFESFFAVIAGATLLVSSQSSLAILCGVFLTGFGLGPIYPLLLAIALPYSENTLIFFIAGVGSAFLPWITGIVSTSSHSLRIGLGVPLAASILMLLLGLALPRMQFVQHPRESSV